ncbi:AAA family ATPase [Nocardia arizonensis]|uniref:AAA family ATPase n=1 Tax=Nocardia arizonensis TaxID=1141647 RepID=UPI0006D1064B|nr:ATP-binding protein [Nocardia arizonensis]
MLIRFEVANFRSILDPVELSMVAVDRDRPGARAAELLGVHLLTVAGIYGPNASGKSNVLLAIQWIRHAVTNSVRWRTDKIPIETFAFEGGNDRATEFSIELLVHGVRYEYSLELTSAGVRYEGLFHYPEKKRRRIFEREGMSLVLQRGLGDLSGTRQLLTDVTLALSAADRFHEAVVSEFVRALRALTVWRSGAFYRRPIGFSVRPTESWFDFPFTEDEDQLSLDDLDSVVDPRGSSQHKKDRRQALALLKLADLGIDDVVFEEVSTEVRPGEFQVVRRPRLVHRAFDRAVPFDLAAESNGTRNWYNLIGPVLQALRSGSMLVLDEIDASLHPTLSAQLLGLFGDPVTNPLGAQLIFTTHDTSLLNHLNRDEVWLTEKLPTGATRLGALADFAGERVRKSQNLENAYLHGRFGALPDVDRAELLRALGIIG